MVLWLLVGCFLEKYIQDYYEKEKRKERMMSKLLNDILK